MLNLGVVNQGSSFAIPIPTRTAAGAAVTGNTLADGDFTFFKDGSTTATSIAAAATTPSTDFATTTGRNQLLIDLTQDTTNFTEGSSWQVWLSKSIDSTTIEECVAVFTIESDGQKATRIAQEVLLHSTTIATLTDQTHFTLTDGDASDDDVYQGMPVSFRDSATFAQKAAAIVANYTASTKAVTLEAAPGYTIAAGDYVVIQILPKGLTAQQKADVNAEADTAFSDYAPATATGLATAQSDLDTLTGADGATLATSQPNYAPAVAGDQMDLVNAPNATALAAILAVFNDLSIADIRTAVGLASANLDTQLAALPTASEISTQVATDAGTTPLEVNLKKINDVTLTGDGSATPFDVV